MNQEVELIAGLIIVVYIFNYGNVLKGETKKQSYTKMLFFVMVFGIIFILFCIIPKDL